MGTTIGLIGVFAIFIPASILPGPDFIALVFGFLVTMTNPKAAVLFTGDFATSVTAEMASWRTALMVALVILLSRCWYAIVSLFMSSRIVITRLRHAWRRVECVAGVCFAAIGVKIMADVRNPVSV